MHWALPRCDDIRSLRTRHDVGLYSRYFGSRGNLYAIERDARHLGCGVAVQRQLSRRKHRNIMEYNVGEIRQVIRRFAWERIVRIHVNQVLHISNAEIGVNHIFDQAADQRLRTTALPLPHL